MAKTHIIVITSENYTKAGTDACLVKPKRSINKDDIVIIEDEEGNQDGGKIVNNVITEPGLLKGWVLLETSVKED